MKVDLDWRLRHGIASLANFAFLLAFLLCFPLALRWTGALSVAEINPQSPQHIVAFLKFCFVLFAFLWVCFAIVLVGIRLKGHLYQGWIRLIPVFLIGIVVTIVALWRKSLVPGMIAHGLGDGFGAFIFFLKHV